MYKRIPPITESTDVVKQRLQREHDGRNKPRFHMLYLLASGQATTRQDVAHVLGLSRNTVGRWLTWYTAGGRTALLNIYVPAGKQPCLPPAVLASVEQARHRPEGFAAYAAFAPMDRASAWCAGHLQDALHHGAHTLHGQAQRPASKPHTQTLMRSPMFTHPVPHRYAP
jgi:hypothetical protein